MFGNKSVTKKVFTLTALMFCVYIALTLVCQLMFYEKFYVHIKSDELMKQIDSFENAYMKLTDTDDVNSALVDATKNNDTYMIVFGENGNILYSASYEIIMQTKSGKTVRLSVDNAVRDKTFNDLNIKAGDEIDTEYYIIDGQGAESSVYIPARIVKNGNEWEMNFRNETEVWQFNPRHGADGVTARGAYGTVSGSEADFISPDTVFSASRIVIERIKTKNAAVKVSGTVTAVTLPDRHNFQSSLKKAESAWAAIRWIDDSYGSTDIKTGKRISYVYQHPDTGGKYLVMIKKVEKNGSPRIIFAVNGLKSVDEAVGVMRDSLPIWIVFGLAVAAFTAVLFSKLITRPILNITQVTSKMKNLDFSQKCVIHSDDEVGRLASNINDMSEKLDNTIKELVSANRKLTDDIEKERRAELARREFVAAVSHELKTPLAIIRAYSEGIADGISGAKRDKYLNVIISETKKMDALVLDMLENSRLEAGMRKLKLKKYDIAGMTSRVTARFVNGSDNKSVEIICERPDEAVMAEFDRDMIEQVMNNFISNAIRHTPNEHKIYITLKSDGAGVTFSVENEGSHIDDEIADKIWDRFYRADKSRGRSSGSTGLGLSIAKNILVLHKAKYGVKNTDRGVVFWFRLNPGEEKTEK